MSQGQLWDVGPVRIYRGNRAQRDQDHAKTRDGRNKERMQRRAAAKLGISLAEYQAQRAARDQERQLQRTVSLAQRRYRGQHRLRAAVTLTPEIRRKAFSAYMLERYHADPANWSTAKKRRRLFERDGWRCRICTRRVRDDVPATADNRAVAGHIIARATGGEWTDANMATLCYPCNRADGVNKLPIQTHIVEGA